jgi:hypothetical protein
VVLGNAEAHLLLELNRLGVSELEPALHQDEGLEVKRPVVRVALPRRLQQPSSLPLVEDSHIRVREVYQVFDHYLVHDQAAFSGMDRCS